MSPRRAVARGSVARVAQWQVYELEPAAGILAIGLERLREEKRLLRRRAVVEERVLERWFKARDRVAFSQYRAMLDDAVRHLERGTFGSYVDVDTEGGRVCVRFVRRRMGERWLEVDIEGERWFSGEDVADSADYAEGLRVRAREENDDFWSAVRDRAQRERDERDDAAERARDAGALGEILRSQDEPESP